MRRTCPQCLSDYTHPSVTAQGLTAPSEKLLVITCSWGCLIDRLGESSLSSVAPVDELPAFCG